MDEMGVVFQLNGQNMSTPLSLLILIGSTALFYALATLRFSYKSR